MAKVEIPPTTAALPVPLALVTCGSVDKTNIITLAWVGNVCSEPPMIGISIRPSRYSHELLKQNGEFVVNIPSVDLAEAVDYCGMASGRDVDKFAECGLTQTPASKVQPALITECPVNIECVVRETITLGTHDLFIGEVLAVHVDEDVKVGKGRIDIEKANPLAFAHSEYWSLGEKVGSYGFTANKK